MSEWAQALMLPGLEGLTTRSRTQSADCAKPVSLAATKGLVHGSAKDAPPPAPVPCQYVHVVEHEASTFMTRDRQMPCPPLLLQSIQTLTRPFGYGAVQRDAIMRNSGHMQLAFA